MKIPAIALIVALSAFANAQALIPPKPKVLATPAPKTKPRSKPKPARAPAKDATNPADLPTAAPTVPEPTRNSSTATTLTGYMPKVKAALAKNWGAALAPRTTEFSPGSLSIVFTLDANGTVTNVKIGDNSTNEAFAKFCDTYVREIQFDVPPPRTLQNGTLEIPFTFSIY